jgi:hypothetical protein
MQQFVHRRNIEHYRKLLAGKLENSEREAIASLLAEEEGKERLPAAETPPAKPSDT